MPFTIAISANRYGLKQNHWLKLFIFAFLAVWTNSFIGCSDIANWLLENTLVFLFLAFLVGTYNRYKFSDVSYLLFCVYLCLHVYGSKYDYAHNPFGFWLQDAFHLARNHYDRIVHFTFGFLLAYPMREMFLKWLSFPKWVAWVLPIEITLSISGFYELVEWAVADVFFKAQGDAYLGTQGDIWDAQKDMALATFGAILATTIVSFIKKVFKVYETGV